jgi:c-di-GMP-related signal transduction protein
VDGDESSDAYFAAAMEFAKTASWDSLLCGGRGLIRADRRLVFSDIIEHMPSNRIVLGLSPREEVDANLSNRLHYLHSRCGTRLLFFGYSRRDPREQLLGMTDAVEIDAFTLDSDSRSLLIRRAQRRILQVLATAVESDEDDLAGCRSDQVISSARVITIFPDRTSSTIAFSSKSAVIASSFSLPPYTRRITLSGE